MADYRHRSRSRQMFKALGLSPSEEDLYTVLIRSPRSTVAELAAYGSVSSQQATRDLQKLVRQGLANRLPGRQARYIAVAPDIAIEPLLTKREGELRQARLGTSDLMKAFHAASRQDHPAELVEIITGEATSGAAPTSSRTPPRSRSGVSTGRPTSCRWRRASTPRRPASARASATASSTARRR